METTKSHFDTSYNNHVDQLIDMNDDIATALAQAVGSPDVASFVRQGNQQAHIMFEAGLQNGDSLYDFACGSGRTAAALKRNGWTGQYIGVDVVPALVDALKSACEGYEAHVHKDLTIKAEDSSLDMICAWSIFTHLTPIESYIYLRDGWRTLRPGGLIVMSFLEYQQENHWAVFDQNVKRRMTEAQAPLDAFTARSDIEAWGARIGYDIATYIDGYDDAATPDGHIGQSVAILRRK